MLCPKCGNENPPKLKFCVNCGTNLEDPQEINYEQVDMGNYHSEDDGTAGGFSFGSGTFTIKDTSSASSSSDIYTADELNDDDDNGFSFEDFDEPFIPKLDTGRVALPKAHPQRQEPLQQNIYGYSQPNNYNAPMQGGMPNQPMGMQRQPQIGGMPGQPMGMQRPPQMGGMPNQPMGMQRQPQMGGMPGQPMGMPRQPQMGGMPNQPMGMPRQPQIGGMPSQPMSTQRQPQQMGGMPQNQRPTQPQPPQIIGYDPSGMPIYAQPVMYQSQPQIIGYDPSGMPIYGQPVMYQPQIIGYDPSGMPIYGQPAVFPNPAEGSPAEFKADSPQNPFAKAFSQPEEEEEDDKRVDVPDDFWEFFDGGKKTEHAEPADDFFSKHDMGSISAKDIDMGRLKKFERKKNNYMSDTPLVNASDLNPNTAAKFNKLYMKATAEVNADDLQAKEEKAHVDFMGKTRSVNAEDLSANQQYHRARVIMGETEEADPDQLEAYVPEHKEALMAQADHAVEAMPKRKHEYVSEVDLIELPTQMQARKSVSKEEQPEIPDLPEF